MGSERLPGKVLRSLAGVPMLVHVIERSVRASTLDEVLVATTTQAADDVIETLCLKRDWRVFRGDETDVLDRYYQAAKRFDADIVVRITADCPLIEPLIIDQVVGSFWSTALSIMPAIDCLQPRFQLVRKSM